MLISTSPWWTATARSIPIGCCALRLSSAHRRAVPGPGQRQSHSGRRPQCGVSVAVGRAADRPVRYITLADNASTTKLKGKQLWASCVIMMAGRTILKMKLPYCFDAATATGAPLVANRRTISYGRPPAHSGDFSDLAWINWKRCCRFIATFWTRPMWNCLNFVVMGLLFICKHTFMLKSKLKVGYWLTVFVQSIERRFTPSNVLC